MTEPAQCASVLLRECNAFYHSSRQNVTFHKLGVFSSSGERVGRYLSKPVTWELPFLSRPVKVSGLPFLSVSRTLYTRILHHSSITSKLTTVVEAVSILLVRLLPKWIKSYSEINTIISYDVLRLRLNPPEEQEKCLSFLVLSNLQNSSSFVQYWEELRWPVLNDWDVFIKSNFQWIQWDNRTKILYISSKTITANENLLGYV